MNNIISIIAVDVGNTRVKISDGSTHMSLETGSIQSSEVAKFFSARPHHTIAVSSVNPRNYNKLKKYFLKREVIDVAPLLESSSSPLRKILSSGTGQDRVLGCIGALAIAAPPLVTIDFGTATTVNVLNARRDFVGGYILPGLQTQAESLHMHTASLPQIHFDSIPKSIAQNTEEAIQGGIVFGSIGAVCFLVEKVCQQLRRETLPVVVTGGNLVHVLPHLRKKLQLQVVDDLVLQGISSLVRAHIKHQSQ